MATVLLPELIGGKRHGNEWHAERKANGGLGDSWKVNLSTGQWANFAGTEKGPGIISLAAVARHIVKPAAAEFLADRMGFDRRLPDNRQPIRVERKERAPEAIPLSAPEPTDKPGFGPPAAIYRYDDAFWVVRWERDGKKQFTQQTWRNGKWAYIAYPSPRPVYRRSELAKRPDAPVLIVEGEKCCEAAEAVMRSYVVLSWAGGANSVAKNDWSVLEGRDVLIWPDADEPGKKAAADLGALAVAADAKRVRILSVDGQPDGWDVADAIADGWTAQQIVAWAKERVRTVNSKPNGNGAHLEEQPAGPASAAKLVATKKPQSVFLSGEDGSVAINWSTLGLDSNEGGVPHPTVSNVSIILRAHPKFAGRLWYDTFKDQILTTIHGTAPRRWTDADSLDLTVFIQHTMRLNKVRIDIVNSGVIHAARCASRNSLTDYLDGLKWDGVMRLETWLLDSLGCEHNAYSMAVAVNWPIAMVARAYQPGCKVDTMPVLEGTQGLHKSTFLEELGGEWFGSLQMAFGEKDFLQAIQGRWIIEIPDMTGFSKREHSQILATITTRHDIYRRSYGHHIEEHPRVAMFAATSETSEYLSDVRGRRRYWPLRCREINIDWLRAMRDQLFAEAVYRYREGQKWYEMPPETDDEQSARAPADPWTEAVLTQADAEWAAGNKVVATRLLSGILDIPIGKQSDVDVKRVTRILRRSDWHPKHSTIGTIWRKRDAQGRLL